MEAAAAFIVMVVFGAMIYAIWLLASAARSLEVRVATMRRQIRVTQEQLVRMQVVHDAHVELSQYLVNGAKVHHAAIRDLYEKLE